MSPLIIWTGIGLVVLVALVLAWAFLRAAEALSGLVEVSPDEEAYGLALCDWKARGSAGAQPGDGPAAQSLPALPAHDARLGRADGRPAAAAARATLTRGPWVGCDQQMAERRRRVSVMQRGRGFWL